MLKDMDFERIVTNDLIMVEGCNGILATVNKDYHSVGTICEIWHGFKHAEVIFVITSDCQNHPWLKFVVKRSGGRFFANRQAVYKWAVKNYPKKGGK